MNSIQGFHDFHGCGVCRLTWVDSYFFHCFLKSFIFYFCLSTLSYSIIKFHDIIQFTFEHNYPGITTVLETLHSWSRWAQIELFQPFLDYIFFLDFCSLTFYLLEIKLHLFSFSVFFGVIMFSFDFLGISFQTFFLVFFL